MNVLGINSIYHESAACLLQDGVAIAMAEEERFNRIKHGKKPRADNADELPMRAIRYCLKEGGIGLGQVDRIGYSSKPSWQPKGRGIPERFSTVEFDTNIK